MSNWLYYTKDEVFKKVRAKLKVDFKSENLNGLYADIADIIGEENTRALYEEYRGQQVNFPVELYSKEYIYGLIRNEYNGKNIKQLATKYEYSERTIRRIVKK